MVGILKLQINSKGSNVNRQKWDDFKCKLFHF